jgi:hypothetical protein
MPKIYLGPYARCACCDKTSPVRLCSAAGPVPHKPGTVQISHALLTRIFRDVANGVYSQVRNRKARDPSDPLAKRQPATYYRFNCLRCGNKAPELFWVEAGAGNWVGGWCKFCLHSRFQNGTFGHPEDGANIDLNILRLNASKKVASTLEAWNEAWQKVKETQEPEPEPVFPDGEQLF